MKTKDHLCLAKSIMRYMRTKEHHRVAFLLGNILPDLSPISYFYPFAGNWFQGHCFKGKKRFIASRLTSNYKNTMLWWYLNGRVMHYLADSFTKPHQIEFNFSKEDHAEYEARLHTYFTDRIRRENLAAIIPGLTKKQRIAWLNRRYEQYMCEANNIETDYPFIVTAAAFALEWLWEASGEHRPLRFIRPMRQGSVFGPVHGYGIGQTVPVKVKFGSKLPNLPLLMQQVRPERGKDEEQH